MVWLCGCAEILDIPDGLRLAEAPRCVARPSQASEPYVTVRVRACHYLTCSRPEGLTPPFLRASLCDRLDASCSDPLRRDIAPTDGVFEFQVPTSGPSGVGSGFDGYLKIESVPEACRTNLLQVAPGDCPDSACVQEAPGRTCAVPPFVVNTLYFNPPIVAAPAEPLVMPMVPTNEVENVLRSAGVTAPRVDTGGLYVTALDACTLQPVAGAVFELDPPRPDASRVYVAGSTKQTRGVPKTNATATDDSGIGGFHNLALTGLTTTLTVTAKLASDPSYRGTAIFLSAPFTEAHVTVLLSRESAP